MSIYNQRISFTFIAFTLAVMFMACSKEQPSSNDRDIPHAALEQGTSVFCTADQFQFPVSPIAYAKLYNGRNFYRDYNHLGRDVDLPEGTPIVADACGRIREYRSASGYGRLVVVIEHELPYPVTVKNGAGSPVTINHFLSIHGHLRSTKEREANGSIMDLDFQPGDMVGPGDLIGYVDADAFNGDGAEHMHHGIRLQSYDEAIKTDPYYFRGYDSASNSQLRYFADPREFLETLLRSGLTVLWHPEGSVIQQVTTGDHYKVQRGYLEWLSPTVITTDRLKHSVIPVTDAEMHCLGPLVGEAKSELQNHRLIRFSDNPAVYEINGLGNGAERWTFLNEPSFFSWGWSFDEVTVWDAVLRDSMFGVTSNRGYRRLRVGSLVKSDDASDVYIVTPSGRQPIADWPSFLALGYRAEAIHIVPASVLTETAGERRELITSDEIRTCHYPVHCIEDCSFIGFGGSGDPGPLDAGVQSMDEISSIDTGESSDQAIATDAGIQHEIDAGTDSGIHFVYQGPVIGLYELQAWWRNPDGQVRSWNPISECTDAIVTDTSLACVLPLESGSSSFEFQVYLPNGTFWGDVSCDSGGCGQTIGTVSIIQGGKTLEYELISNGIGPEYMNGRIALIL